MSDPKPTAPIRYAKNAALFFLCALAPALLSAGALWSLIERPDTQGWRLGALQAAAALCLVGSLLLARVTARAWRQRDGWLLRKGYGFITEEPAFWTRLLRLPELYFDNPDPAPAESSTEEKLWTELVEEEALLAAERRPDPSATPIKPKRSSSPEA